MIIPDWFPKNPYPVSVFSMTDDEYVAAIPDTRLRTAISGYLGRVFWDIASKKIAEAYQADQQELLAALEITIPHLEFICEHNKGLFNGILSELDEQDLAVVRAAIAKHEAGKEG